MYSSIKSIKKKRYFSVKIFYGIETAHMVKFSLHKHDDLNPDFQHIEIQGTYMHIVL